MRNLRLTLLTGKSFRLRSKTIAVEEGDSGPVATTVPEGSVVRVVRGPAPSDTRLVDVEWRGRRLWMFAVDIEQRGDEVSAMGAG